MAYNVCGENQSERKDDRTTVNQLTFFRGTKTQERNRRKKNYFITPTERPNQGGVVVQQRPWGGWQDLLGEKNGPKLDIPDFTDRERKKNSHDL